MDRGVLLVRRGVVELDELDRPKVIRCLNRTCGASTESLAPLWGLAWLAPERPVPAVLIDPWLPSSEPDCEPAPDGRGGECERPLDAESQPAILRARHAWSESDRRLPWDGGAPLPQIVEDDAAWRAIEPADPRSDSRSETVRNCGKGFYAGVDRGLDVRNGRNWCRTPSQCRRCGLWWATRRAHDLRAIVGRYLRLFATAIVVTSSATRNTVNKALSRAARQHPDEFGAAVSRVGSRVYVLSTHPLRLSLPHDELELEPIDALPWFVTNAMVTPHFHGGAWRRYTWRAATSRTDDATRYAGRYSSLDRLNRVEELARFGLPEPTPEDLAARMLAHSLVLERDAGHSTSPSSTPHGEVE